MYNISIFIAAKTCRRCFESRNISSKNRCINNLYQQLETAGVRVEERYELEELDRDQYLFMRNFIERLALTCFECDCKTVPKVESKIQSEWIDIYKEALAKKQKDRQAACSLNLRKLRVTKEGNLYKIKYSKSRHKPSDKER